MTRTPIHTAQMAEKVPQRLLQNMVICLGRVDKEYFPQVLDVFRDLGSDAGMSPVSPMEGSISHDRRAGYTVDMSVSLGNALYYDVHDASQGYSLWTEDEPARGKNWYCILPNVHGRRPYLRGPDGKYTRGPDGRRMSGARYRGLVIKLAHGVAISWDVCVI